MMIRNYMFALPAIILLLSACRKEEPKALPGLESIVGKWRQVRYQAATGEWREIESYGNNYLVFRFDGVLLDSDGLPACCMGSIYNLNGNRVEITPQAPVEENPLCYLVDCIRCDVLNIEFNGPDRIVVYCDERDNKAEYVKE